MNEKRYQEEATSKGVINCLYSHFKNTPEKLKSKIKSCLSKGDSFALGLRSIKEKIDKIKNEPDFYEQTSFLTLAQELLKLVKENKVAVTFLSAYDKRSFPNGDPRKRKIFSETFGKFPNCSLELIGFDSEGQGSLTIITGPMFAGKTSLLIDKYNQCKNYQSCLVFKPVSDKRYSLNDIVSHRGEKITAISITNIAEIEQYKEQAENIFIDEIHFFASDAVPYLEALAQQGKKIIVAVKLAAKCQIEDCEQQALTKLPEKSTDYVGGGEKYGSYCRQHYVPIAKLEIISQKYNRVEGENARVVI
ncbi:13954_t:CDS:2 [Entrophospora sp. SA101]|nr:1390_t:CDS:2 [Entrophospora sp. SA101]CAJ0865941.1 13954_t:CDS:2 [Entrophospora sp. SA101]